jgi:hypothetical protein
MEDKKLNIRISTELFNMLKFKAIAAKKSTSKYIRESVINSDIKVDNSKDINRLISSLNLIGNNINQIAHILNIANKIDKLDDVNYNNLLDRLIVIEYKLKDISND